MKNKWFLRIVALFCFGIVFLVIYLDHSVIDERLNSVQVIHSATNIPANTELNESHLIYQNINRERLTDDMVTNLSEIIGKRTLIRINEANVITKHMVDQPIRKKDEQRIFPIPNNWIESTPGSLRRLDEVDIWLIPTNKVSQQVSNNVIVHDSENNYEEFLSNPLTGAITEPILRNILVAYVKNTRNTEVIGEEYEEDRLDAHSSISDLELLLTDEQIHLLLNAYKKGYKFTFSY